MKKITILLSFCFVIGYVLPSLGQFGTSLHKTRQGKPTWYNSENGGYETLTGVSIEDLGCVACHPADGLNANGDPVPNPYEPLCEDCHATNFGTPGPVTEGDCLGCHGRQSRLRQLGVSDVHRDASVPMVCWDCHGTTDMHGDGTAYNSMLEPGAVVTDCEQAGCHESLPSGHSSNDPHNGALHCSSCHMQTNLSCYNCHFDSQVEEHVKRAKQPITGFVILVNREKDGKVHPATFQSLYHDSSGGSWIAMAPNYTHSVTKTDARTCGDCHNSFGSGVPAIEEYNLGNGINFASWNSNDSTLSVIPGIVPLPVDYEQSFIIDFITYEGNLSDPPGASKNWTYVKNVADGFQLLYCTPMTLEQMDKLGMDTSKVAVGVKKFNNNIPREYTLEQNYPNPFNPTTMIRFSVPLRSHVELVVYDALGDHIETLVNGEKEAGVYEVEFNARGLASGVYFYQIKSDSYTAAKKLVLMK